jgi:hypothetical protein
LASTASTAWTVSIASTASIGIDCIDCIDSIDRSFDSWLDRRPNEWKERLRLNQRMTRQMHRRLDAEALTTTTKDASMVARMTAMMT